MPDFSDRTKLGVSDAGRVEPISSPSVTGSLLGRASVALLADWLERIFGPDVSAARHEDSMSEQDWLDLAESAIRAATTTTERYWLIHFEDAARGIEVFNDEQAARARSEQVGESWNHTLFVEADRG